MTHKRKALWSQSFGHYGSTVRLGELNPDGPLYLIWRDRRGKTQRQSLKHRDRIEGRKAAMELLHRMATETAEERPEAMTLGTLVRLYVDEGLIGRGAKHIRETKRKLALWTAFLGASRLVESLSPGDVQRFSEARRKGLLVATEGHAQRGVSATTIWHDYVALNTALAFLTRSRDRAGRPLLLRNPLLGTRVAKTPSPKQPVASRSYYEAMRAVAPQVSPSLQPLIDIAAETGHRISAILALRITDIDLATSEGAPYGAIRWRAENDKIKRDHTVAISPVARSAVVVAMQLVPSGCEWLFPSPTSLRTFLDRYVASRWLRRAEKLAGIDHSNGSGWHAFRRGWASARKHLPDVDVAAAGGWKDTVTLKRCYQHADQQGILRAVCLELPQSAPNQAAN